MKHGTFGKSSKSLKAQEKCWWMDGVTDFKWQNCKGLQYKNCLMSSELTMLRLLGVLLKIMKCVTPSGPAIATKSFSTFFFLIWGQTRRSSTIHFRHVGWNRITWVSLEFKNQSIKSIWLLCGRSSVRLLWRHITEQSSHNSSSSEPNHHCFTLKKNSL